MMISELVKCLPTKVDGTPYLTEPRINFAWSTLVICGLFMRDHIPWIHIYDKVYAIIIFGTTKQCMIVFNLSKKL